MKLRYLVIGLFLLLACLVFYTLYKAGSFKKIAPHHNAVNISFYTNMPGPEDIDISYNSSTLFISSTDRRTGQEGGIYGLDMINPQAQPEHIPTTYKGAFHPHGISVFESDSSIFLHVVNHNEEGDFIELFEFSNDTLFHSASISSSLMCCPNDVVAVAPDRCYVTNDHGNKSGFMRILEDYLSLPLSGIVYYNGKDFMEVYDGMSYANGINISPDGKYIYATETTGRKFLTLERNADATLSKVKSMNLKSGLDNIDIDRDGNIWIGSHPKMLDFVGHAKDAAKISPSQIFKITPGDPNYTDYQVEEVFLDDGTIISGSSIAVHHEGKVYVGVVFDHKVLQISLQ
jgi:arylesterase/paraoxonase